MRIQGAVIKEQGVTFAVVVVEKRVLDDPQRTLDAMCGLGAVFPGMPVVLMAQDRRGCRSYYGRKDISRFLSSIPLHAIPWREYTIH